MKHLGLNWRQEQLHQSLVADDARSIWVGEVRKWSYLCVVAAMRGTGGVVVNLAWKPVTCLGTRFGMRTKTLEKTLLKE